jgi:hypothetical protein
MSLHKAKNQSSGYCADLQIPSQSSCHRSVVFTSLISTRAIPLGLVRFRRIAPGIVPANQSLYKLEKQSGQESFRPTNPAETNKALKDSRVLRTSLHQKEPTGLSEGSE